MTSQRVKGIGLLSGGLDSILAVKVLQEQDLELLGITFKTPFFGPDHLLEVDPVTHIPMQVIDIGREHLEMLQKPVYGYGSQMNPCIDCHALMLRKAGQIMEQERAQFLFTGEVLGQRPMSQRRDALRSVEKLSGYTNRVLRPLSAKLLPATLVEEQGLVDRTKLLDIHGRSRKRQMALAEYYGIKEYPQPGGGCMLTKAGFSQKLRVLLERNPNPGVREVELLKWGRHFLLPEGHIYCVGRNRTDNDKLHRLAEAVDFVLDVTDHPGPRGVLLALSPSPPDLQLAAAILLAYSDAPLGETAQVTWGHGGKQGMRVGDKSDRRHFEKYLI